MLPMTPLVSLPLLLGACADDCEMASTLPGYTPMCEGAKLAIYPDETRILVLGQEGSAMVIYLPAPIEEHEYGGTSGFPMDVIVDAGGRQFTATVPEAELSMYSIGDNVAGAGMTIEFTEGWVHGSLVLDVEYRR